MQTLRKKTSPLKYKNETTRFLGDGVSFKAKLIGILEVAEARGDRMCQEALADLKMAIRAAGEHKQRITVNVAIDGLRLRDEKTGDSLYHHPVHKISFIAQDMTDSRAFGYIFGSPDTGHRFFGIKTDKAASQVVIAMRDLFQVVFALKKKEIELAKQHLEKTYLPTSPLFSESSTSGSKLQNLASSSEKSHSDSKGGATASESKTSGTAVANLVDLELELSSLQQGLNQMERITPSDPFGSKDDPFGDSFISYPINKPILPPPPPSGRDRSSRTSDSSGGGAFSPRTPHGVSADTPSEALLSAKETSASSRKDFSFGGSRDEPSSGDWFTPTTGNSLFEEVPPAAEVDEKHEAAKKEILSQFDVFTELDPLELKNPPKKALNDLAGTSQAQEPPLFSTTFSQASTVTATQSTGIYTNAPNVFSGDPFGEDPFVKEDPFANSDFSKQDPFDTEFATFPCTGNLNTFDKKDLQSLLQSSLSKSPKGAMLEKQMSLNPSPKTVQFSKQNTFDVQFDDRKHTKLSQLHENPSLDISSESECAPEPPPRPAASLMQIKPPPLPPKKQNDFAIKPPPRPPHTDDTHYEHVDHYETAPNSLEISKSNSERNPPLPVPSRKSKFENDFTTPPERPKKQFNLQSSEEDYLTPISFPEKCTSPTVLLPPPQKSSKKQTQVTVASFLESKPNITTSTAADNLNTTLEGLDMTLSQLTLSGLNELANKLNIPPIQLNNMTLVQLTNYLSNFIKDCAQKGATQTEQVPSEDFKPDFAANFNNMNNSATDTGYDRYAVFRELQEEIKQTKIDTEPEQIQEENKISENIVNSNVNLNLKPLNQEVTSAEDKYAALREIVEIELQQSKEEVNQNQNEETINEEDVKTQEEELENINTVNKENVEDPEKEILTKSCIIEYADTNKEKLVTPTKSPIKSPTMQLIKSPVPNQVTEIIQNNTRLTSGSLSDVISGSSPEIDNTGSNSDPGKKTADATGESWAIFDHATAPPESSREKPGAVPSEEGVSPWSSDSKEYGDGSPPDWRQGSGSDQWSKRGDRTQEGWWDTSAEPEAPNYPPTRRSTDSYEEESREGRGERPARRRRQGGGAATSGWQAGGGHSSSSRDVSPWEEERRPRRRGEGGWPPPPRHPRGHSFERRRDRAPREDSWDDEDEYEYDEEQDTRFHWAERHGPGSTRDHDWGEDWTEDRRHRRRREGTREIPRDPREPRDARDRWCCPDWEQSEYDKSGRYPLGSRRPPPPPDRYGYSREESPWEDEGADDPRNTYLTVRRGWRQRPSSASETDRRGQQVQDGKQRYYIGAGGSDGERDRRYKPSRRSRSRDSQYSEPSHRHKPESVLPRAPHRPRPHPKPEVDKPQEPLDGNKKPSTATRKKTKDVGKSEEKIVGTFPKKGVARAKSLFENDFVADEARRLAKKFNFDEFEAPEGEGVVGKQAKSRQLPLERERHGPSKESKLSPRYSPKSKSLFEDDFSPSEKPEQAVEESNISSIKEETDPMEEEEEEDSFGASNFENASNGRRKMLAKNRLSRGRPDVNLKKSESINIFSREIDPFDDDFFSGDAQEETEKSPRGTELRWTDDFE